MIIAYILAALAAVANAASSLLQREGNRRQRTIAPYRRPVWWGGVGAATVSFCLQAGALGKGSLAAIEPILALELALVVFGAGLFFHMHIGVREWVSTGLLTFGTIVLVIALDPQKSHQISVLVWQWAVALGTSVAVIVACFLIATRQSRPTYRGALLGIATGVSLGLVSSLLKGALLIMESKGVVAALEAWQLYAALALGAFTFWLLQHTLSTTNVVASQPGITLADPVVAIAWGGLIYGENMRTGWAIAIALLAAAVVTVGAIMLARSPVLRDE